MKFERIKYFANSKIRNLIIFFVDKILLKIENYKNFAINFKY